MQLAIMQPYFMPYIGYFQLINSVDEFIIYDNIEFTKKGWINRNRILVNGRDQTITIPLKKDSDYLDVCERRLAGSWATERRKLLNRIIESYRKSPYFGSVFPIIENSILFEDDNLFNFIFNSIILVNEYLGIPAKMVIASTILIDHNLKSENKVIEICKSRRADRYLNSIGGMELYSKESFKQEGIELQFLKSGNISYKQYDNEFIPWLSIIDVMMFNSKEEIKKFLSIKTLI